MAAALAELAKGGQVRERMAKAGLEAVETQRGAAELTVRALRERCLAHPARDLVAGPSAGR